MSVAGSLIPCPPTPSEYSTALDDAHGLALRPWRRPRRDDRQLHAQADRRLETIGDAAPERRDLPVLQAESTAAGDQLGRRLDLDLTPPAPPPGPGPRTRAPEARSGSPRAVPRRSAGRARARHPPARPPGRFARRVAGRTPGPGGSAARP